MTSTTSRTSRAFVATGLLMGLLGSAPLRAQNAAGETPPRVADLRPYSEVVPGTEGKLEMLPIPVGTPGYPPTVRMGSPSDEAGRGADEGPPLEVELEPFWIGKYEVTWDVYDAFRREYGVHLQQKLDPGRADEVAWADAVSFPTPLWEQDSAPILAGLGTKGGFPAADISPFAAMQFTKWLSARTGRFYRLPTEAEWEYVARAGTRTAFFFGDDPAALIEYAWTFDNSAYEDPDAGYPGLGAGYRKVGSLKPNPWGVHDIYGNVSEWVVDQYAADHYAQFEGKVVPLIEAVRFATTPFPIVARGGNWESDPADCRSAARLASDPQWQYRDPQIPKSIWWYTDAFHVGFRIVRPLRVPDVETRRRFWDPEVELVHDVQREGGKQVRATVEGGGASK